MPLHILQLGPYPPPEGGITRNVLAIRDEARRRGHRCSIIATSQSTNVVEGPDVYHPRSPVALVRLLASLKYDVLHLHIGGEIRPRVLSLASACSLFGRGKSLLTVHSGAYPLTEEARNATPNSVRSRIFRRFTRLIGVNDAIADVFRRSGVAEERVRVILPYVLTPPDKQVELPSDLKAFCDKHSPLLVSVGGLEKDYDPLFLVDAMSDVVKEFPNAGLMIVGDGSMRDEVESVVAARVCADRIFLAGNVDHAVTLHMINDADVMLRATLFDGDAISVREALFLGTPVIATDNGMRPEGVHLVGMQDGAGLIAKLKQALAAGKKPQAEIVDGGANIREIVDIYEEIAASV